MRADLIDKFVISRLILVITGFNSHIRHTRWRKECGRLWVQLASTVQAPMHSVAYMYIDSY